MSKPQDAILLKGSLFTLTVLHLCTDDFDQIATQLHTHVNQAPNFFQHTPVVIDCARINTLADSQLDFALLNQELRKHSIIPVGIRHANEAQQASAITAGFALLPDAKETPSPSTPTAAKQQPNYQATRLITQPVRSGQQIYARHSDLIVLASVSHGAELLADGHIHVHGPLRGRALAGINGNREARIFCKHLDAELVSIAGFYRLHDDLPPADEQGMTQVYLNDEQLHIENL